MTEVTVSIFNKNSLLYLWDNISSIFIVAVVKDSFRKMLENGVYKADLFADL